MNATVVVRVRTAFVGACTHTSATIAVNTHALEAACMGSVTTAAANASVTPGGLGPVAMNWIAWKDRFDLCANSEAAETAPANASRVILEKLAVTRFQCMGSGVPTIARIKDIAKMVLAFAMVSIMAQIVR